MSWVRWTWSLLAAKASGEASSWPSSSISAPALKAPGTPVTTSTWAGLAAMACSAASIAAQWRVARALRLSGRRMPTRASAPSRLQVITSASVFMSHLYLFYRYIIKSDGVK